MTFTHRRASALIAALVGNLTKTFSIPGRVPCSPPNRYRSTCSCAARPSIPMKKSYPLAVFARQHRAESCLSLHDSGVTRSPMQHVLSASWEEILCRLADHAQVLLVCPVAEHVKHSQCGRDGCAVEGILDVLLELLLLEKFLKSVPPGQDPVVILCRAPGLHRLRDERRNHQQPFGVPVRVH